MKKCFRCKETKSLGDFNKKSASKDGYQPACRQCSKALYKKYYNSGPEERKRLYASNKEAKIRLRSIVRAKKNVPCADCNVSYPHYVMDFDHQRDKSFTIAKAVAAGRPIALILLEIEKCEVVCSNCHRIRTHSYLDDDTL